MSNDKRLALSVHEAADMLGVVPATVYAWVREGEIPSIRLGGRIRIPTAKLADLLGVGADALIRWERKADPEVGGTAT